MKNYTLLLFFFTYTFLTIAQNNNSLTQLRTLIDKEKFAEAELKLNKMQNNVNISSNPVFWIYKGVIYHSLYDDAAFNKIPKDSLLNLAYNSYKQARKLDKEKKYNKSILEAYGFLVNQFTYEGINNFNNKNYKKALHDFENSIAINSMAEFAFTDTVLFYNSALAAEACNNFEKAENYYKKSIELKFGNGRPYLDLAKLYKKQNNTDKYIYTLKEGLAFYPENKELVNEIINYYLTISDTDNCLIYTKKALNYDKNNSNIYFILGSLYENKNMNDSALSAYKKAVNLDSTNTDVLYNIGAIYYNKAVNMIKHAQTKQEKEAALLMYKKSLPYMEKVSKLEPENRDVLYILKNTYHIIGDTAKKELIEKKLQ